MFGDDTTNVFLDPDKIDSEKIAYFINQLIEAYDKNTSDKNTSDKNTSHKLNVFNTLCSDKENMKFVARSASAGSLLVLSSFLKNQNAKEKTIFFQAVVAKLFPLADDNQRLELQNNAQKLMEYIAKEVNFVNPPGILFNASLAHYLNPKLQSLAVGKEVLASEQYFIKMISAYLSGGFKLDSSYHCHMSSYPLNNYKNAIISSVADEIVFPFCYVAMFAEELKTYNLDDEKISKFVYKVMQYGDIGKKEGDELNYFCQGAINELNLSDDKRKEVSDIAKKYLNIRNDYLALQKTYWRDLQKECSINLGGINDSVIANNKQVKKNFVNSAKALYEKFLEKYEKFLENFKQEYRTPHGIARVFDLWEAIFRNELKGYNLGDEKIFKFVDKVMQHGKIVKKTGDTSELNYDCQLAINELNLSDDQRKEVSDIAKKYLEIKDDYLALRKTYWRDLQKECPTDLGEINEQVIKNNNQVEKTFLNSVEALYNKLLQNHQELREEPIINLGGTMGVARENNQKVLANKISKQERDGVETPSTAVGSVHGLVVLIKRAKNILLR